MKKIILDSNFLTIPHQFNIDIFDEIDRIMEEDYQLYTLDGVLEELKKLKGKDSVAAKIGLELLKKKKVKIIKTEVKSVDNAIIEIADENTIVATNDKELKHRLKNRQIKTIYLRNRKFLEIG